MLSNENCSLKEQINSKNLELKKMLEDIQFYNSKLENIDNDKSSIQAYINKLEIKIIAVENKLTACNRYIANSNKISKKKKNAEIILQYEKELKEKTNKINILQENEKKLLTSKENNKKVSKEYSEKIIYYDNQIKIKDLKIDDLIEIEKKYN